MINTHTFYDQFTFEKLQPRHIDQVIHLFTHTFCDSEPMARYLKLDYKTFTPFAEAVVEKAAYDELSIIALEGDQVIACALVEDIAKKQEMDLALDPKFDCIFGLLKQLDADFFAGRIFPTNLIAHLLITAVDQDYRGNGLSRKVNFAAMQLAYDNNFQYMCSELTNYLNEKGTMKYLEFNKLLINSIPYHQFLYGDKQPFKNLPGTANAYIWELCKDAKFTYNEKGIMYNATLDNFARKFAHA